MIEWFHHNYDDPAHHTPYISAEGGYQYIWGGPHDAREELDGMFGGLVPEQLIGEAVEEVETETDVWVPVDKGDRYDREDDWQPISPPPLEAINDIPGPAYGTSADLVARQHAIAAVSDLATALRAAMPLPAGIGHNQPPEPITATYSTDEPTALSPVVEELKKELEAPAPKQQRRPANSSLRPYLLSLARTSCPLFTNSW